jgi:hypothetical protein
MGPYANRTEATTPVDPRSAGSPFVGASPRLAVVAGSPMERSLFEHVLLPVASESDARATAGAVLPHIVSNNGTATVANVIEKAGGAPTRPRPNSVRCTQTTFLPPSTRNSSESVPVETRIDYRPAVDEAVSAADDDSTSARSRAAPTVGPGRRDHATGDAVGTRVQWVTREIARRGTRS